MARVLIVYNREPGTNWRSTYESHLKCLERNSAHEFLYFNVAFGRVSRFVRGFRPDLVVFHYTFLAIRTRESAFDRVCAAIEYLRDLDCPKALIPHDEQYRPDLLCRVIRDFGVTHVFTPAAEPQWRQIYAEVDFDAITFTNVLTGYLDDRAVRAYGSRGADGHVRRIDVGYRSWSIRASHGRHGRVKYDIGRAFEERATAHGVGADISSRRKDAFLGKSWFEFLLRCKYTLGVEGGSSIMDWDGSYAACASEYAASAGRDVSFEELEEACFPGVDGSFDYRIIGPRHFEAVVTRTCQVLVEGDYNGIFKAGVHYIPVKRDLSNVDQVLDLIREDSLRGEIVERAYRDIVESGRWTYSAFAELVLTTTLSGADTTDGETERSTSGANAVGQHALSTARLHFNHVGSALRLRLYYVSNAVAAFARGAGYALRHRWSLVWLAMQKWWFESGVGEVWWNVTRSLRRPPRALVRDWAVHLLGEERLWRLIIAGRNALRRLRKLEAVEPGPYVPTDAEIARLERKAEKARSRRRS